MCSKKYFILLLRIDTDKCVCYNEYMKGADIVISIVFDRNRCKGCGLCVDVCPKNIIYIDTEIDTSYGRGCAAAREGCIGCASCYTVCPDIAVTIKEVSDETSD